MGTLIIELDNGQKNALRDVFDNFTIDYGSIKYYITERHVMFTCAAV